jgi:simple sugar transport system permease protein
MEALLSLAFLVQVLRISVPYVLAALGGTFSERGGVVNIALEGILLVGAFGFVVGTWFTGLPAVGVLAGVAAGVLLAGVLGLVTVRFGADHIVAGVAVNLLAVGLTRFFLNLIWDSSSNSARVPAVEPLVAAEGGSGLLALLTHPLVWLALGLLLLGHAVLFRTRFGLRLRACGEHPEAAATLGVRVRRLRWAGVLLSGGLAGLAGVWLASDQHQFTDNMSNGRGFIALAAMIFGKWRPLQGAAACLLFGAAEALQIALQGTGSGIPTQFLQMLPYLLTVVALVGFMGRATPPAAVGRTYEQR